MKKTLNFILCLLIVLNAYSQTSTEKDTSIKKDTINNASVIQNNNLVLNDTLSTDLKFRLLEDKFNNLQMNCYTAGINLEKYKRRHYTGLVFSLIGSTISAIGVASNVRELYYLGVPFSLVGIIKVLKAPRYVAKAGKRLKNED
jgi:hypothetical protein